MLIPADLRDRVRGAFDRWRIWIWLAKEYRPSLRYVIQAAVLIVVAAALSSGDPMVVRWIIDTGIPSRRMDTVITAGLLFLLLHAGRLACTAQSSVRLCIAGQQTVQQIRIALLEQLFGGGGEFHDRHRPGALAFTLQQDVDKLTEFGGGALFSILRTAVNTVVIASTMISVDPQLALCVLGLIVPFFLVRRLCFSRLNAISIQYQESSSQIAAALQEYIAAAHHVFLLSMERFVVQKLQRLQRNRAHHERKSVRTESRFGAGATLIYIAAIPVVLCGGGYQIIRGHSSVGLLMAFYAYLMKLFDPLSAMADIDTRLSRALASLQRVYQLALIESPDQQGLPMAITKHHAAPAVWFQDVAFGYGDGAPAVRGIELRVEAGEKVLLAGPSGSGKSTLLKLGARQYRRHSGRILYFGTASEHWSRPRFREIVGVAPQNSLIFECTLLDNIVCGRNWVRASELEELLWITALDEVVAKLRHGIHTHLGSRGARLSGGEQQRVGLARALAGKPELILLDECTSGLDGATEARIYQRMRELIPGSTMIIASHRKAALDFCDRIVVLENGEIARQDNLAGAVGGGPDYGLAMPNLAARRRIGG